jgi:Xaa-Pro dipeptidase
LARKARKPQFIPVDADDLKPMHQWHRPLQAPGITQVDFEERVDFKRLHRYRLARTRQSLAKSGLGAMLCFDQHNIRYISSTVIGAGRMGYEMAGLLARGGADVLVWNRTKAKAEPLQKYGAKVADDLSELAARDIVFCME